MCNQVCFIVKCINYRKLESGIRNDHSEISDIAISDMNGEVFFLCTSLFCRAMDIMALRLQLQASDRLPQVMLVIYPIIMTYKAIN